MKYIYRLIVESELDEVVCELEAGSLESLEEQIAKVQVMVQHYENKQEQREQAEFQRQKEDNN